MKYIKKFEGYVSGVWSVGDYILLNLKKIKENYIKDVGKHPFERDIPNKTIGQITKIHKFGEEYPIDVTFYDNTKFEIEEREIKAMATIREREYYKEQVKMYNSMKKYNL